MKPIPEAGIDFFFFLNLGTLPEVYVLSLVSKISPSSHSSFSVESYLIVLPILRLWLGRFPGSDVQCTCLFLCVWCWVFLIRDSRTNKGIE